MGRSNSNDVVTDKFTEVEHIGVGPTSLMDEDGVSPGLVLIILGSDNRTGQEVGETCVLDLDLAREMCEQMRSVLQEAGVPCS